MIRDYKDEDFQDLINAWLAASHLAHPFLSEDFIKQEIINIRDMYLPNTETFVYELGGKVIGFTSLMGHEVGAIFLDPAYHGRGIGKAMMDRAVEMRGRLELDVFKENSVGQRFYFRYGFKTEREHLHEATGNMCLRLVYEPEEASAK